MTIQAPSIEVGGAGEAEALSAVSDIAAPAVGGVGATTDEHLLALFLRGERDALGRLAQRHEAQLLGLAYGLTGGRRDLALDAVQETWLRVIKYGKSFKQGSTVKTWLYRILINTCKDIRSRASRMSLTNPERQRAGGPPTTSDLPAAPDSSSDDSATRTQVRTAIESLTGDQRLLVLLCYHQGLTHPQAAEVLNIPVGTLKSRLHTILNALRAALESPERKLGNDSPNSTRATPKEPTP